LPRGRQLITLKHAADCVTKLPKAEQKHERWQTAMSCLIMAAERRGPLLNAQIGMMQALHRHVERAQPRPERPALGTAEAGAGSVTRGA